MLDLLSPWKFTHVIKPWLIDFLLRRIKWIYEQINNFASEFLKLINCRGWF